MNTYSFHFDIILKPVLSSFIWHQNQTYPLMLISYMANYVNEHTGGGYLDTVP